MQQCKLLRRRCPGFLDGMLQQMFPCPVDKTRMGSYNLGQRGVVMAAPQVSALLVISISQRI